MSDIRPLIKVEIGFATTPISLVTWYDVTADVLEQGVSIRRGRGDEFQDVEPGTATVVLRNDHRNYEPEYTGSLYYPNIVPMQRIRISATWDSVDYPQFTGYIEDWRPTRTLGFATITLSCVDILGTFLSLRRIGGDSDLEYSTTTLASSGGPDAFRLQVVPSGVIVAPGAGPGVNAFPSGYTSFKIVRFSGTTPTAGTYTITHNGYTTPAIPYDASIDTVRDELERLPSLGPNSILGELVGTGPVDGGSNGYIIHIISNPRQSTPIPVITSSINGGGIYAAVTNVLASSTGPIAEDYARLGGRKIRITTSPAFNTSISAYAVVIGTLAGTRRVIRETIQINGPGTSFVGVNRYDRLLALYVAYYHTADAGKLVTFYYDTEFVPETNSADQIRIALAGSDVDIDQVIAGSGASTLLYQDADGSTLLDYVRKITQSEGGIYYADREGQFIFKGRLDRYTQPIIASFGTDVLDLPYSEFPNITYNTRTIHNDVTVTTDAGDPQRVQNNTSIERYFSRTLSRSAPLLNNDTEAYQMASFLAAVYGYPAKRVESISFRGELNPPELWPILLAAEINEAYNIDYKPTIDSDPISINVVIDSITMDIDRDDWHISWSLSRRPPVFVLDTSSLDGPDILLY